ncbi:transcription factor Ouib-like [Vespa velutina]|uniref:transcription factor Ouib-like n=1 Tax=Vespa velutina TaxID=202808 RepID=UPI001FB446D4|nr:transcription factor Ouib-like [Vespa velutina]
MEEVTKCSYINCRDLREKEQIFHELPVSDIGLCVKWLVNSGHEYLIGRDFATLRSMKFFVCSNHFKSDSYLAKGTLKENAVPQPYWYSNTVGRINDISYIEHEPKFDQVTGKTYMHRAHNIFQFKEQSANVADNTTFHEEGWCRTCAMKKNNVVNMTLKKRNTEMSLLSKLKLLIEIDDEDTLPLNMCYDCVKKLEQSFQFFQQIYIADNTLRHIFPKGQLDNDCYGITIDRVDGCVSDIEFDPILPSNEDDRLSMNHESNNIIKPKLLDTKDSERSLSKKVSTNEKLLKDTSASDKYGTVFSLLTDTCHSDEELHWTDVLNAIERQKITFLRRQVPVRKTKISCEFCISKFRLRRQLKTHIITHHPKLIRTMCMDCITYYENELLLLEHRAIEHNDDQWYRCDYCQKVFSRKKGLRLHITRSHARRKCYSCDLCNQQFVSKQNLSLHIESGHLCVNIKKEKTLDETLKDVCMVSFDVDNANQSNNLKTPMEEQKIADVSIDKDFNHMELSSTCPNNESQSIHLENAVHSVVEELIES